MAYPVKWFSSDMPGAPELTSAPGSLISLLDACLVNGWGLAALDSLTYDSETGTATGTVATGHAFTDYQVIEISGADQAEFNGAHRIVSRTTTTFTFEVSEPGVSAATGTLSVKIAPAGWLRLFDNGQGTRVVYKPGNEATTSCIYCFDDTNTLSGWNSNGASAFIFPSESATAVDALGPLFQKHPENTSTRGVIRKDNSNNGSTPCSWALVADARLAYLYIDFESNSYEYAKTLYVFGEFESYVVGDQWNALVSAGYTGQQWYYAITDLTRFNDPQGLTLARKFDQFGGATRGSLAGQRGYQSVMGGHNGYEYPNKADNGLLYAYPAQVQEHYTSSETSNALRGWMPGLAWPLHHRPTTDKTRLELPINGVTKAHIALNASYSSSPGQVYIDIDGPWRA